MFVVFSILFLLFAMPAAADPANPAQMASSSTVEALSGVARLRKWRQDEGGCTAVLIAPALALTAAHCARNPRLPSLVFDPTTQPNRKRVPIAQVIKHPEFVGGLDLETFHADLAVLVLKHEVPAHIATPIPLGPPAAPGAAHAIYGYVNPGNPPMHGHPECRIDRIRPGLLGSDCSVRGGMSGSPLLAGEPGDWRVAGIVVATVEHPESDLRALIVEVDRSLLPASAREGAITSEE